MSTELHCDHKSQLRSFAMSQPEEGTDEMKNLNESLREKSIRDSTRRQYETADGLYKEVCGYPVTGERLQIFIRALLSLESPQLTENTIAQYVSGVKTLSEIRGEDKLSPTEEQQVKRCLLAAKKTHETQGKKRKQAPVLDEELIDAIIKIPTSIGSENDQLKTVTLLSIAKVSRLDEIYDLKGSDVEIIEVPGKLRIRVKIVNPKNEDGDTHKEIDCDSHVMGNTVTNRLCTVKWCAAHELRMRKLKLKNDNFRLFPKVQKTSYAKKLKKLVNEQYPGMSSRWSLKNITGHSLRRTGSTILKLRDVSEGEVQASGKWRSSAWLSYTTQAMEMKTRAHANIIMGNH